MSEQKYLLDRIKRIATKAIEAERNGELKTAFEMFLKAAELLNQLIAMEHSQKVRDSYYIKAKEYISRAKELKVLFSDAKADWTPNVSKNALSAPPRPKTTPLASPPRDYEEKDEPSPPPSKETTPPPPPPPREKIPPPPPGDMTAKMMRGEDDEPSEKSFTPHPIEKPKTTPPPPPTKEKIDLPTKTTYEILYDERKYRDCIVECAKSVEAELRVRMGLFDEQLTLGMLIDKGINKGMDVLREFKTVNIYLNRIEHENYRPTQADAQKAIAITTKILVS